MKKLVLTSTLAASMILSGCATTGSTVPTGGNNTAKKAGIGALAGALAGATISKATGGEKTGRDAAIGAAIGAGIGAYMSRQEAKLKEQTAGTGIEVQRDPVTNNINLIMPESITFAKAQSNIRPEFYNTLNKVASTLQEYNQTTVTVGGHASSEGDINFNQRLSEARASAVLNYLVNRGVSYNRVQAYGYGISRPIADNSTEYGRSQNRRVEITINAPQSIN